MTKIIVIILLAAIVIVGGGLLIANMNSSSSNLPTATSTPSGVAPTDQTQGQAQNVPQATVPTAPTVTTDSSVSPSNATAVLTGKVTPNGAQTSYWYEYGTTDALGSRTVTQNIGSGFVAISAPTYLVGLSANTGYAYRLVAQNSLGTVDGTLYHFSTNNTPPPPGNAPTSRTGAATNVSRTGADANGTVAPGNSQTSYWFEYGESAALGNVTAFQSAGNGTASVAVSIPLANLKPLTRYFFRLNAQNQFGTSNGAIMNFTTQGPATASAPSVTTSDAANIASSTAILHGQVNSNGAATTYWFEYSLDSGLATLLGSTAQAQLDANLTASASVSTPISGLQANTRYYYRLVAANPQGTVKGNIIRFQTRR